MTAPSIPDPCPKCGTERVVREGMFYFSGRTFSGLVCVTCNALWNNPEDSFEAFVAECARTGPAVECVVPDYDREHPAS